MITKRNFSVECEDGFVLKGMLLIPESPKAIIQFNGGTGAKKEFYLPFVKYLAENDYVCCLWDYRGSGDSDVEDLSKCEFSFLDYGIKDMPAIKKYLESEFPELPFMFFGHSVGGQQIGFINKLENVKGMVNFAVSTGYLPYMPLGFRLKSFFLFYIFTPLSSFFTGYVNASRFGIMEDLPTNVVKEWRSWCSQKSYFFDSEFYGKSVSTGNFANYNFPIHVFWATDDPISNKKSVPAYWSNVSSAKGIDFTKLTPAEINKMSIGHFGFFKKRMKEKLWPSVVQKFDQFLEI
ncbi:alpha/beta hydrolase [Marivirga sp. S37H4]|uniref:Alpha/beta hydrolase n=1 Tax=Marivirga aurantiaca TaxID=2802615 RepID=A0A935CBY8_9BACT|nr:alpha/beta hydrolase [Marivirga aurantiaca]MBK6267354.1 alpha/beta hydrolase [Marivirga aurantiaca]